MSKSTALKIAALIVLAQGLAQAWTVIGWQPHDFVETIVATTMKGSHLSFGGATRTYWDLYVGYGLLAALAWIVEAGLLWILAGMGDARGTRAVLLLLVAATVIHAAATFVWFTPLALVFDVPVALLLLVGARARAI
jgi:hypothetical protein